MSDLTVQITVPAADAALLSEAYRFAQFYPDTEGNIQLPSTVRAALRRVLDEIDEAVNPL